MMSGLAGLVWCAVSAPMIEGFLVGLGIAVAGLAVFPFGFRVQHLAGDKWSDHAASALAVRWGKVMSWLLVPLATVTIGGYVAIYVGARGKYCDAGPSPAVQWLVVPWAITGAVTVVTLGLSVWLRRVARGRR
jgi:hypothetical protein